MWLLGCLVLAQPVLARRLSFPLIGVEVAVPSQYRVEQAGPVRVQLVRPDSLTQINLYRVEFGNLEKLSGAHEKQLMRHLRQRVGKGGSVTLVPYNLAGRRGHRVLVAGNRSGTSWIMNAAWSVRGGQAVVVEVLAPAAQRSEGQELFQSLCTSLVWVSPERG